MLWNRPDLETTEDSSGSARARPWLAATVTSTAILLGLGLGVLTGFELRQDRPGVVRVAVQKDGGGLTVPGPHLIAAITAGMPRKAVSGPIARIRYAAEDAFGRLASPRPPAPVALTDRAEPSAPLETPQPTWQRFAAVQGPRHGPMIAVVIDDRGMNRPTTEAAIDLPSPLTLAFLSYAPGLPDWSEQARGAGHELLLHVPMEPVGRGQDPGPRALEIGLEAEEVRARLLWALDRLPGFVGINNHMGSRFTADEPAMMQVMEVLDRRGLLFLDSRTSAESRGWQAAVASGVPYAVRDVFLDHDYADQTAIRQQLDRLESIARRQGYAVAIGHPHATTLAVLRHWLPAAAQRGLSLVPVSAIVQRVIEANAARTPDSG